MIDIKLLRENPELVKENIKKKFQDKKLVLVDEVLELDKKNRAAITEVENLRAERTKLSKQIGALMGQGKKDEAEAVKAKSTEIGDKCYRVVYRNALSAVCQRRIMVYVEGENK